MNFEHPTKSRASPRPDLLRPPVLRNGAIHDHDLLAVEIRLREALVREESLRSRIDELLRREDVSDSLSTLRENAARRIAGLTARQRQVMDLVIAGHPSKTIAADLGISQRTVENHRAAIMSRTESKSIAVLARLALAAVWNGAASSVQVDGTNSRTVANDAESEPGDRASTETRLRDALTQSQAMLRKQDAQVRYHEHLSAESDHRLLNGLQMISSLLSMQSRNTANAETAAQLAVAAGRVATIDGVHRRLHSIDGREAVAFKQYVEDLCRDFSAMAIPEDRPDQEIVVEGVELELPSVTAVPLGFIINELITNAVKYGKGRITVRVEPNAETGHALSVSNGGSPLPEGFDPAIGKGLGMKIIRTFVDRIGGELRFSRGDKGEGTCFTVLFH